MKGELKPSGAVRNMYYFFPEDESIPSQALYMKKDYRCKDCQYWTEKKEDAEMHSYHNGHTLVLITPIIHENDKLVFVEGEVIEICHAGTDCSSCPELDGCDMPDICDRTEYW